MTESPPDLTLAMNLAMDRALAQIEAALGSRGQWSGDARLDRWPHPTRADMAAPLTALGMLALAGVPHPRAAAVTTRSAEHLLLTIRPGGLWRYYANIPPDTDDTAMCALALGPGHPEVLSITRSSLLGLHRPDGRFPTWFEPGWQPAVDAVANAHVVAVLGPELAPAATVGWLLDVVARAAEVEHCSYYPDPLDLHVALVRGVGQGVASLLPAVELAADRARDRLAGSAHLTPYRVAQAMVVLAAGDPGAPALSQAVPKLLDSQRPDDRWPADTLFTAGNSAGPGTWHYRSWLVVTAMCVRALWLAGSDPAIAPNASVGVAGTCPNATASPGDRS